MLLLLCACSPVDATEDVDRWSAALGNGDYAAARTGFRRVLERIDTNHPSFVRAKMGAIEAQIHIDPRHATYDFVDSARKGRQFGEREFCAFASKLVGAGHCDHGFTVLAEAAERFGRTERVTSTIEWVQRECDERAMRLLREHFY